MTVMTLEGSLAYLREQEIELLNDLATTLADFGDEAEADLKRLRDVAQDCREMFFMVAIIGEFNAGKSTFVNALIGEKLLPIGITPTTEFIELIRYSEIPVRKPTLREDGLREWGHPNTGMEGVAIVDTPGTGSVFKKHETTAKDFLHRSDLVIFVLSAKHAFAETERLYLELARNYGKKIVFVVNQIDLLEDQERHQVRRFIEAQAKEKLDLEPLIFMVSAKTALEAGATATGDPGGVDAVRAYLRGVYAETSPAKQKLTAQLDTAKRVLDRYTAQLDQKRGLLSADMSKAEDVKSDLERQSLGLEQRMREASNSIDRILEGVRERGLNFIDENLSLRKLGRSIDRQQLQKAFEEVVVGRAIRELNNATGDYTNAVIDQSRLYWRGVIDRLNQLRDLMDEELGGLDSSIYAEQRESLENAIRIAESELKSYSTGQVVEEMERTFSQNMQGFQGSAVLTAAGVAAMLIGYAMPGAMVGATAAPLALPVFLAGGVVTMIFGVPTLTYYQRLRTQAKKNFNERIDELLKNYHDALDDLTHKERSRLEQYGNQVLRPIFNRLDMLTRRYDTQQEQIEVYKRRVKSLREDIQAIEDE